MNVWELRRIRKEHKLTQAQLAEKIGVNFNTVNNWETGKTKPDIELFSEMARALGMKPSELCKKVIE